MAGFLLTFCTENDVIQLTVEFIITLIQLLHFKHINWMSVSLSTTLFLALINYLVKCHEVQTFIVSRQCILLTLVSLSLVP